MKQDLINLMLCLALFLGANVLAFFQWFVLAYSAQTLSVVGFLLLIRRSGQLAALLTKDLD